VQTPRPPSLTPPTAFFTHTPPSHTHAQTPFSAAQNEIHLNDAKALASKGVKIILEGANMPTTNDAIQYFHSKDVVLAPAKACNAGA
jgi:hypothetical protein